MVQLTRRSTAERAASGASSFTVSSQGASVDAAVSIQVRENNVAKVVLQEGTDSFEMRHDGAADTFAIGDGTNNLLAIKGVSGAATLRGDLTVGFRRHGRCAERTRRQVQRSNKLA